MKRISLFLVFCILSYNSSYAYIEREADIVSEKIIPFTFNSENINLEEGISIRGMDNVKIEEIYVDNGSIEANIEGNYINLLFNDGKKFNSLQTVTKTDSVEISNIPLSSEDECIIQIELDKKIKEIKSANGDFESAQILSNGEVEIKVDEDAKGVQGYDSTKLITSRVNVKVDPNNKLKKIESEWVNLEHEPIGKIKAVSGDTSAVEEIITENNCVKVNFNNGNPKLNDIVVNNGHTYFWIDRDVNGRFKKYNPNSIYSTDKNKISGKGEYLNESEKEQLGMLLSNNGWLDYCGVEINGVRYIYPFDAESNLSEGADIILYSNYLEVNDQEFNSEKYTVWFSKDGVLYIPEGKLYSMGELVSNTNGWGEVMPNHDWESKETFFNEITGKYETYVKHYKFFYGPKNKIAFGGSYTYPYECTLEYKHYKPVNLYSGQVIYSYDSEEYVRGYLYNGWIKISYSEKKTVNDYPPTSPYNVKYNPNTNIISWKAGMDDYTPENKLTYEIQVYAGTWGDIIKTGLGENNINYIIDHEDFDLRVRTVDEVGQVSDWSGMSDSLIELSGEITPNIISPGDMVNINAKTKSLNKIEKVEAICTPLGINSELNLIEETKPEYFEMSYDVMANFLETDDYVYVNNTRFVKSNNGRYQNFSFVCDANTNSDTLEIPITENMYFTKNGTIVMPNDNYLSSPIDVFVYNKKRLFLHMTNEIGVTNKKTGNKDCLVAFENTYNRTYKNGNLYLNFVPKLMINNFEYDEAGNPQYIFIELKKEDAGKPIVIRWNTDVSGLTRFDISLEDKEIYSFCVKYEVIEEHIEKLKYVKMIKYLRNYVLYASGNGYKKPSNQYEAEWAEIVCSIIPRYNLNDFPWLGYKVNRNEYVNDSYILNYNNNPAVRNTYRTLILDEYASDAAVKKYINLIKSTNFPIKGSDKGETAFADDVLDYNCKFSLNDIFISEDVLPGKYEVELIATDVEGNSEKIILLILVEDGEKQMYPDEEETEDYKNDIEIKDILVGRFFYKNGLGHLEELKKEKKNSDTEGFICAGETIGVNFIGDNVEFLEIDFIGDDSIKTLDSLTKLFLIDKPKENGKDVTNIIDQYDEFPKKIYPESTNTDNESEFKYFYTIPYGTKQNIHSWSTLRNSTLERIEVNKLFNRIKEPYILRISVNGSENVCYEIPFDVFERWDTVINRDVSEFIINSSKKWEIRIDK